MCNTSRRRFAEIDKPPNPELNLKMYDTCVNSNHPSIYLCKTEPETGNARKLHQTLKKEVKKIEKREKRRRKRKKKRQGRKKRNKKKKKKPHQRGGRILERWKKRNKRRRNNCKV